jgi:hypothetical protein
LPWWQHCIAAACFFEPDASHNGAASGSLASGHPWPDCLGPQCSLWNCGGSQGASSDRVSILRLSVAGHTCELSTWRRALVRDAAGVCPCSGLTHSWWQVVACQIGMLLLPLRVVARWCWCFVVQLVLLTVRPGPWWWPGVMHWPWWQGVFRPPGWLLAACWRGCAQDARFLMRHRRLSPWPHVGDKNGLGGGQEGARVTLVGHWERILHMLSHTRCFP